MIIIRYRKSDWGAFPASWFDDHFRRLCASSFHRKLMSKWSIHLLPRQTRWIRRNSNNTIGTKGNRTIRALGCLIINQNADFHRLVSNCSSSINQQKNEKRGFYVFLRFCSWATVRFHSIRHQVIRENRRKSAEQGQTSLWIPFTLRNDRKKKDQ